MSIRPNTLNIAESFYSVQCEGHTTGYPAYFIRLKGCNLSCGLSTKHLLEVKNTGRGNTNSGSFVGDLHKEGTATWTCDTAPIWLFGDETTHKDLVQKWIDEGIYTWIKQGIVHLIWTGGEPTIPKHQKAIISFLDSLQEEKGEICKPYNEIETNGTFYLEEDLFHRLQQINCSVKLANSGMEENKRIVPEALRRIMEHENYWFKFVISTENDIEEIQRDFIKPFNIPNQKVIMMPGLDDQDNFHERTRFCLEMAKKYGYIGLTRLHVSAWNKTTGV
jgi:7-carboxy-7-deazaguanine synthase